MHDALCTFVHSCTSHQKSLPLSLCNKIFITTCAHTCARVRTHMCTQAHVNAYMNHRHTETQTHRHTDTQTFNDHHGSDTSCVPLAEVGMSMLIFEAPYRTKEKRYEAPPQYIKLKWWPPQASHADTADLGALRWAPALLTFLRLLADASKLSHGHPQHQKLKIDTCDYDEKCRVCVLPYSSNTAVHKIMHYSWVLKKLQETYQIWTCHVKNEEGKS